MSQPTNLDILKQLETNKEEVHAALETQQKDVRKALATQNRQVQTSIKSLGDTVMQIQTTVTELKDWQTGIRAVESYKNNRPNNNNTWMNKELLKALGVALTAIAGLIALLRAGKWNSQ